MIYYKPLEIDYFATIINKCLAYVKTVDRAYTRSLANTNWYYLDLEMLMKVCPELQLAFQKHDLKIIMAAVYVMYLPKHSRPHIDAYPSHARVNLPLLNCQDTYTNFYTSDTESPRYVNPDGGGRFCFMADKYENLVLVDRVEIKQATVLRTKVLHSVYLPIDNPVPRITLSLAFDKDPIYLLEN